jgi:aminopeptidase N
MERDFVAQQEVSRDEYEEAAQALQLPLQEMELPDVKMILLIEPEHKAQVDRHFNALKTAIKYYGLWYGPYPYETITMVDPPFRTGSGGMEYPTLFTAGTSILKSQKVLSPEAVIIHEFGHSYWYGLCANNEFEEAWLDEGINTYSEGKVKAAAYGRKALSIPFNGIPLIWFFKFPQFYDYELDRALALHVVELDPITTDSWRFFDRISYGLNVYQRASLCLYTLERLVGSDAMLRILRTFQMRFRYGHPHTQDFIQVVNEVTGKNMDWYFEELFFSTLNFDYGIDSLRSREKKEHVRGVFDRDSQKVEFTKKKIAQMERQEEESGEEKLYLTEVKVRRFGEARISGSSSLEVEVMFEDGSKEVRSWRGQERWKIFNFIKPVKAKYAQIDPDRIWLVDSNLSNNSLKREPTKKGILRLTTQILFLIQNYLHSVASIG